MIALVYAHPYPDRSRANRILIDAIRDVPGLRLRSLYEMYPDFGIDVEAEQAALLEAQLIVWQHPLYWYSVPGLLKHWYDKVLARGWAYGEGGVALAGKTCLWVTTTGGDEHAFSEEGMHEHQFRAFVPPIEETARFCRMRWAEPIVLHGAHRQSEAALAASAAEYRRTLIRLSGELGGPPHG